MIWTDETMTPIEDTAPYVGPDGTWYPGGWDKATIPGLVPVVPTDRPADSDVVVVTGWIIEMVDSVPTQVWQTAPLES